MRSVVASKAGAELQFVEVPKFPDVAPVQVDCARAQGRRATPAANASNTAIRIRRTEVNRGLEFMAGGMNGVEGTGMKAVSPKNGRTAKPEIPSSRAELVCKRRKRHVND